ncbi:arsenate reductase [Ramlibacter sp.]|uniref:arsenate reductase n=1 Tax=Ramlibacter sp. TaxID=1917967 RepID=UPI002CA59CFA|nr:arsenate reductase [Ramlibacter sp.]HWI82268.1 arsenate reductase [Ramlibacter sp.]
MTATLYGISNCDTVKKARAWLAGHGVDHRFHDFRKDGVPAAELRDWLQRFGWDRVVNRQGSTWRRLDPAAQARVCDEASAHAFLVEHPSAIKRPVVQWPGGERTLGFDPAAWSLLPRR